MLTVYSYGNDFREHETIIAHESGYLPQWVEFEIRVRDALVRVCFDEFDVEIVVFRYCE